MITMKMSDLILTHIEKALGITLYENQRNYLLENGALGSERNTGRTTAYCVKLALSEGEPLDLRRPETFSDEIWLDDHRRYSKLFFKRQFMEIRQKLQDYGFKVRDIRR